MNKKILLTSIITFLFLYLINKIKGMSIAVSDGGIDGSSIFTVIYVMLYIILVLYYLFSYHCYKCKNKLFASLVVFLSYAFIVNNLTLSFGHGEYGRIAHFLTPIPILTLLFFTRFVKKEPQLLDYALNLIFFFVLIMGITYFMYRDRVLLSLGNENAAVNTSYFLMYSLPLVMCVKKNSIKYIMMLFILFAVMMSFKRTGFAATLLAIAVYYFIDKFLTTKVNIRTIVGLIVVVCVIVYIIFYISELTDGYLFVRFTQAIDNGDSRDELRVIAFRMIVNSDFLSLLFGHGYDMMMYNSPEKLASHNDYLEVAYDYGLIGFVLYLNIYLQLFLFAHKLLKVKSRYAAPLFASLALLMLCSFFSHIFLYHHFSSLLLLFWAIAIVDYQNELYNRPKVHTKLVQKSHK